MPRPARPAPAARALPVRPPDADVLAARAHLLGLYVLLGLTVALWLARLPTVRDDLA